jgi:hypothetical protein
VSDTSRAYNAISFRRTLLTPPQTVGQRLVRGWDHRRRASRWHVENQHFCGVLAIRSEKIAFSQRFLQVSTCVIKKPWL